MDDYCAAARVLLRAGWVQFQRFELDSIGVKGIRLRLPCKSGRLGMPGSERAESRESEVPSAPFGHP